MHMIFVNSKRVISFLDCFELKFQKLLLKCLQFFFHFRKQSILCISVKVLQPDAPSITVQEKIMIQNRPNSKIIGRILGPRGISVKQLEAQTGCRILIRGKGSVKVKLVLLSFNN